MALPFTPWTLPVYSFPRSPSLRSAGYHTKSPNQNLLPELDSYFGHWVCKNHLVVFIILHDAEYRPCAICCHQIQQINYSFPYTISIIWRASLFALGKVLQVHCLIQDVNPIEVLSCGPSWSQGQYPPRSMVSTRGNLSTRTFNNGNTLGR